MLKKTWTPIYPNSDEDEMHPYLIVSHQSYENKGVSMSNPMNQRCTSKVISRDEKKQASVLPQCPSCNISNMNAEDLAKIQNLISDNKSLTDTLEKSNQVLRQHFSGMQTQQEEIQALNYKLTSENLALKKQIIDDAEKYNAEIAALQKEINITKCLNEAATFKTTNETIRQENDDLVKQVSDQFSIIQNLSSRMEKLELDKLNAQTDDAHLLRVKLLFAKQMELQTETTRFNEKDKEFKQTIEGREAQIKEMRHDLTELKVKNIRFESEIQEKSEEIEGLRKSLQNALDRGERFSTDLDRLVNQTVLADAEKDLKVLKNKSSF